MLFSEYIVGDLIGLLLTLLIILIAYQKWRYQYWRRRNFPYLEPRLPFGNSANTFTRAEHAGLRMKRHYDEIKSRGWKHGGLIFMLNPNYLVVDLDYLKNIMTKDFQYFTDRGFYYNERDDPLSAHLFNIGGAKWKHLRTKLTPTFTSGKMKMMFQMLMVCEPNLQEKIAEDVETKRAIDIKETLGCFTTDIIGSCAFGLDCQTFKEGNSPFREYGRKAFGATKLEIIKFILAMNFARLAKFLRIKVIPNDVSEFFMKIVKDTVSYREQNNVTRKDFIQLLIELKNNKLEEAHDQNLDGQTLTIEEIAAQSFVFFLAGFETSSTTMTFALYELARHQDLQQNVRDEIEVVLAKHGGRITYEAIQDLKYMDQVINETLRLYPPLPFLTRECVKDYKLRDQDLVIEKGTSVIIPVYAIHHDEDHYPDPEKFDPERFSEENKGSRHQYAHIPFGEGPRICIGLRFGLIQSKVGLTSLLQKYSFTVSEKTQEPLKMKVNSFVMAAEGEIWLDAHKI